MSFRTVVIKSHSKLEYSLGYLVVRSDQITRILVKEIKTLIVQNTGVSLTAALLSELVGSKVTVMFCDSKSNPQFELYPYFGNHSVASKFKEQICWNVETMNEIWQSIIRAKIINQSKNLSSNERISLQEYARDTKVGDVTNREGHAAKVYFRQLFGPEFSRHSSSCYQNAYLDFGYTIILSAFNRCIVAAGYLTHFGIHHIGETNPFNLSCDLMEPLRPLVDRTALSPNVNDDNFKTLMINLLEKTVIFNKQEMYLENAIEKYVRTVLNALKDNNPQAVDFIEYEL